MPTCTLPYEVLFEFTNDTSEAATLQLVRRDDGFGEGAMILLQRRESVSLVLDAGATYQYTLRQGQKAAKISWVDSSLRVPSSASIVNPLDII
jgi:hypothetical protein